MPKLITIPSTGVSISEAGALFRAQLGHGNAVKCPCCRRLGIVVRRKLHSGIASSLCWLVWRYRLTGMWIYVPDESPKWLIKFREWGRLRFWGLVEARPGDDEDKKTSGMWRPTPLGFDFADGVVQVPECIFTYDNSVVERSRELIHIEEALDARFSYRELLDAGQGPSDVAPR